MDRTMKGGEARRAGIMAAALALLAAPCLAAEKTDRPTPSGLPVPRYVSLKFDTVNARSAPGDDSRLLWVYHARGLPVQVVAETAEWRRICDPDGGLAWVHRRTTDGKRMAMRLQPQPLTMHAKADPASRAVAFLAPRALAELDRCDKDGWCRLKAGRASGWVPAAEVWGTAEEPKCR
ncbi:MAG: SH3 domain-containing protein [Caulobacteraceae bacterium]